jgi:hypothetical protein
MAAMVDTITTAMARISGLEGPAVAAEIVSKWLQRRRPAVQVARRLHRRVPHGACAPGLQHPARTIQRVRKEARVLWFRGRRSGSRADHGSPWIFRGLHHVTVGRELGCQ